jgi:hypothetical protein
MRSDCSPTAELRIAPIHSHEVSLMHTQQLVNVSVTAIVLLAIGGSALADGPFAAMDWGNLAGTQRTIPSELLPAGAIRTLVSGGSHVVVIKSDESVRAWGYNDSGQASVPASLLQAGAVRQAGAGHRSSIALTTSGTVAAWGNNNAGQSNPPALLVHAADIAASYDGSFAIGAIAPACAADLNGDGLVNGSDLVPLLNSWGVCPN